MLIPKEVFEIRRVAMEDQPRASNGILVERLPDGRCRAAATDGKQLVVTSWDDSGREEYPVPEGFSVDPVPGFRLVMSQADAKAIQKSIPKKIRYKPILGNATLDERSSPPQAATTNLDTMTRMTLRAVEGDYPNVYECMRKTTKIPVRAAVCVDPVLLADVLGILAKMHSNKEPIEMEIRGPLDPILIRVTSERLETVGLIMPKVKR